MSLSEIKLHPRLCYSNFWTNSCRKECKFLHLRRTGRKLIIFNAASNINRISRKIGNLNLVNMRMPTDCEFYCVDSQIDPEDFGHSVVFNCPGIFIAKAIGYHPSNAAPKEYFRSYQAGLTAIDSKFTLAFTGPFGGVSAVSPEVKCDSKMMAQYFTRDTRTTALAPKDESLLDFFSENSKNNSNLEIVFMTANQNSPEQLSKIMNLLRTNPKFFATFSSDSKEFSRKAILKAIDRSFGRKILLQTASPSIRNVSNIDLLPLAIVNFVVELFIYFSNDQHFVKLGYSLAEFNTFFVENGFNMIEKRAFTINNNTDALYSFDFDVRMILGLPYLTHKSNMSYGRLIPSETSKINKTVKPVSLMEIAIDPKVQESSDQNNVTNAAIKEVLPNEIIILVNDVEDLHTKNIEIEPQVPLTSISCVNVNKRKSTTPARVVPNKRLLVENNFTACDRPLTETDESINESEDERQFEQWLNNGPY